MYNIATSPLTPLAARVIDVHLDAKKDGNKCTSILKKDPGGAGEQGGLGPKL